jgi:hypothetical protein
MRTETDPVSETLCYLEYWTMDNVKKLSNPDPEISFLHPVGDIEIWDGTGEILSFSLNTGNTTLNKNDNFICDKFSNNADDIYTVSV